MKKVISMMLMLCAIITFSACSSDDDGPSNPVTNAVVPASAKIGSEVTIQGTGFAAGQSIWLQAEGAEAINANATMAASGATFTIPYSLNEGKVNVILKVDNNSFALGSMTLLAADNPISALAMPTEVALGKEVTVAGLGFAEGDKIMVGDQAVDAAVTADGMKFAIPADKAEGDYSVSLVRGNYSWALGTVYAYVPRLIESITISNNAMLNVYAPMLGLAEPVLTINFAYNEDGSLKSIASNGGVEWDFAYEGKTITTTSLFSGAPLTYKLDDQGRIVGHTGYDMYGDPVNYTWSYDANGYLASVKKDGANDDDDANLLNTYTDGNLSAYHMSVDNMISTDKAIRTCPYTIEPLNLVNGFGWMQSREDFFLGFLLNRNVKVSAYVPSQMILADTDMSTGEMTNNTVSITSSFENNTLTMQTPGDVISSIQGLYANKVVITYKNK